MCKEMFVLSVFVVAVTLTCQIQGQDIWEQETLTNGFWGLNDSLAGDGIEVGFGMTNIYQLNVNGGTGPYSYSWTGGSGALGSCDEFIEQNGMVHVEFESLTPVPSWTAETAVGGYTDAAYLEWKNGDNSTGVDPAGSGRRGHHDDVVDAGNLGRNGRHQYRRHQGCLPALGAGHIDAGRIHRIDHLPQQGARSLGVDPGLAHLLPMEGLNLRGGSIQGPHKWPVDFFGGRL